MEYPHHRISTKRIAKCLQDIIVKDQVKKINIPNTEGILTGVNLKKANKIKFFDISFQDIDTKKSPCVNVCAQPRGTNDSSEFIESICLDMSECSFLVFLNFYVDGFSTESKDICRKICDFLVWRFHIFP